MDALILNTAETIGNPDTGSVFYVLAKCDDMKMAIRFYGEGVMPGFITNFRIRVEGLSADMASDMFPDVAWSTMKADYCSLIGYTGVLPKKEIKFLHSIDDLMGYLVDINYSDHLLSLLKGKFPMFEFTSSDKFADLIYALISKECQCASLVEEQLPVSLGLGVTPQGVAEPYCIQNGEMVTAEVVSSYTPVFEEAKINKGFFH